MASALPATVFLGRLAQIMSCHWHCRGAVVCSTQRALALCSSSERVFPGRASFCSQQLEFFFVGPRSVCPSQPCVPGSQWCLATWHTRHTMDSPRDTGDLLAKAIKLRADLAAQEERCVHCCSMRLPAPACPLAF